LPDFLWSRGSFQPYKRSYFWVEVELVKKTRKAVLVKFDGRRMWMPKVWILRMKRIGGGVARIKVSEYDWAKKFV